METDQWNWEVNQSVCVFHQDCDGRQGEFVIENFLRLQYSLLLSVYSITVWFSYSECHFNNAKGDDIDLYEEVVANKPHMGLA